MPGGFGSWADRWQHVSAAEFRADMGMTPPVPPPPRPAPRRPPPRRVPQPRKPRTPQSPESAFARRAAEFAVGTVRGYRWWALNANQLWDARDDEQIPRLHGIRGAWGAGANTAECVDGGYELGPGHVVPFESCGCGFWAYWKLAPYHGVAGPGEILVAGVIEGYGRTLIGELGFRCAQARIVALHVPPEPDAEPRPAAGEMMRGLILSTDAGLATSWEEPPASAAERVIREAQREVISGWLELAYQVPVYREPGPMLTAFPPDQQYA